MNRRELFKACVGGTAVVALPRVEAEERPTADGIPHTDLRLELEQLTLGLTETTFIHTQAGGKYKFLPRSECFEWVTEKRPVHNVVVCAMNDGLLVPYNAPMPPGSVYC